MPPAVTVTLLALLTLLVALTLSLRDREEGTALAPRVPQHFKLELDNLRQWKRRRRHKRIMSAKSANETDGLVEGFKRQWPVSAWRQQWFTEEDLGRINRHWLQFAPPPPAVHAALGSLYLVLMLVGCSGNGLVLFMYIRCRTLRTPGNILVANLALSDFFMLAKTPVFIFNSFHYGPALGQTGCVIYGFVGGLTGCTTIATLAAIALDRYWAIVRPLEPLRALTALRAKLLAVGAWLYAAAFSCVPALDVGYGRYVPEGYLTSCSFDYLSDEPKPKYFILAFFCAAWVVPFATIAFCYLNILRVVVFRGGISAGSDHQMSTRHEKEQVKRKAEMKLAGLVMGVIALFFVSWTPYAVVALLGVFGRKDLVTPTGSMIPALFCKTAACINPFVYIITHPKFRKEFRKIVCRRQSKGLGGTTRTIGYTEANHRHSKELSESDVEVVEMASIPYRGVRTVSTAVADRDGSQRSVSMKSFDDSAVAPPTWFAKPQFAKKRSFHRVSGKSAVSYSTAPPAVL